MKPIFLICGPPGCGKTTVIGKLRFSQKFVIVEHDSQDIATYASCLYETARAATSPVLADIPLNIEHVITKLRSQGVTVYPVFIVEEKHVIMQRLMQRDGVVTTRRLKQIDEVPNLALRFSEFQGDAEAVFRYLSRV